MMVKFIKLLPKKEMVLYIIFALLYSCQGIVIPVIIQMAGHLDSGNSQDLIVFLHFRAFLFGWLCTLLCI